MTTKKIIDFLPYITFFLSILCLVSGIIVGFVWYNILGTLLVIISCVLMAFFIMSYGPAFEV